MPSSRSPGVQPLPSLPTVCPSFFSPALIWPWLPLYPLPTCGSTSACILSVPTLHPWVLAKIFPSPIKSSFLLYKIYLSWGAHSTWFFFPAMENHNNYSFPCCISYLYHLYLIPYFPTSPNTLSFLTRPGVLWKCSVSIAFSKPKAKRCWRN